MLRERWGGETFGNGSKSPRGSFPFQILNQFRRFNRPCHRRFSGLLGNSIRLASSSTIYNPQKSFSGLLGNSIRLASSSTIYNPQKSYHHSFHQPSSFNLKILNPPPDRWSPHSHHHQPANHKHHNGSSSGLSDRGDARPQWRRGPRGLAHSSATDANQYETFTLFVDGISRAVERSALRNLFEDMGHVVDLYISKKHRVGKDVAFGFIRYKQWREALNALKNLNGLSLKNSKLRISMAKYQRDGSRFGLWRFRNEVSAQNKRRTMIPSFRITRNLSDADLGGKSQSTVEKNHAVDVEVNSTKVSKCHSEEAPTLAQVSEPVVDSEATTKNNNLGLVQLDVSPDTVDLSNGSATPVADGVSNIVVNEKASSTSDQIKRVTLGDTEKSRSCRTSSLKKIMNIKDIHNFLGYYGPKKA